MSPADTSARSSDAIEVRDLRFAYARETVLRLDRFRLGRSANTAVIGPSGCGKSTFVHLLAGLLSPDAGSVRVLGQDLAALAEAERDRFRGRYIGFVFQRLHLLPALSVRENLALARRLARRQRGPGRIDTLLERLGLAPLAGRKPRALSHGQAQRAAIARALVHEPELVIADEPTSALDDGHAGEVVALLREVAADSGAALLIVTHDHRVRGRLDGEFALDSAP